MKKLFAIAFIAVCALIAMPTYAAADGPVNAVAEAFLPTAKLLKTLDDIKGPFDIIDHLRTNAEAIVTGSKPTANDNSLQGSADTLRNLAKSIQNEPLPSAFDTTPYKVSLDEFTKCDTREASLTKIRGYLEKLRAARAGGVERSSQLGAAVKSMDIADQSVKSLIDLHEKAIQGTVAWTPAFNTFFQLQWLDLTIVVRPALADLRSETERHRKKIDSDVRLLETYIDNVANNIVGLEALPCLDGHWASTDGDHRFKLVITGSSVSWTEQNKSGATLTRQATLKRVSNGFRIERANDDEALSLVGFQPSLRQEILSRRPQPSYMVLARSPNGISGEWHGLLVTKDANAKLKELKQPSDVPGKSFGFTSGS
jgi:hypothetical protein